MTEQRRTIHQVLADARARYRWLEPGEAFAAMQAGALLIDTRTDQRARRATPPAWPSPGLLTLAPVTSVTSLAGSKHGGQQVCPWVVSATGRQTSGPTAPRGS
jgi:hypothetical protein